MTAINDEFDVEHAIYDLFYRRQYKKVQYSLKNYRHHLLALECARVAVGDGADPVQLSRFLKKWKDPLLDDEDGPVALIRKYGKRIGHRIVRNFDITGAINLGIEIIAAMGPLLQELQMHQVENAMLSVVPNRQWPAVGRIINAAPDPGALLAATRDAQRRLRSDWNELLRLAELLAESSE